MSHKATAQSLEAVSTRSLSERVNSSMLLIVSVCGWNCFRRAETQNNGKGIEQCCMRWVTLYTGRVRL